MTDNSNVLPFKKGDTEPTIEIKRQLIEAFAQALDTFVERTGSAPTAASWCITDDLGKSYVGWDATRSVIPASAVYAMHLASFITRINET